VNITINRARVMMDRQRRRTGKKKSQEVGQNVAERLLVVEEMNSHAPKFWM
jgi:hypothetical protein